MSGIGLGTLLALIGVFLFGAHEPAGLFCVISGFVWVFTGMANQQDQKRLKAAQIKQLSTPHTTPALAIRQAEDQDRAAEVFNAPALPILSVSLSMQPGEYACYRAPSSFTEAASLPSLAGGRYVDWDAQPATIHEGELYITNLRLYFSSPRATREIPLHEIAAVNVGPGALEIHRRSRPRPILLGVAYPAELAAYIERARNDAPAAMSSPIPSPALMAPGAVTMTRSLPQQAPAIPNFIICANCGAANGLSANFCQNCAAPIIAGSTPTLNHPGQLG